MGHIGQESALRFAGTVRLHQRILQQILLLHRLPDLAVHIAEAHDDSLALVPLPGTHNLHLEILCITLPGDTVVDEMLSLFSQLVHQVLSRRFLPEHITVFLVNKGLYILLHALFQRNFSTKNRTKHLRLILRTLKRNPFPCTEVKIAHPVIVNAQSLD